MDGSWMDVLVMVKRSCSAFASCTDVRNSRDCAVYVGIMSIQAASNLFRVLLQRGLEAVDTFFWILKQCIVESFLVHVCISNEPAVKEWPSFG